MALKQVNLTFFLIWNISSIHFTVLYLNQHVFLALLTPGKDRRYNNESNLSLRNIRKDDSDVTKYWNLNGKLQKKVHKLGFTSWCMSKK